MHKQLAPRHKDYYEAILQLRPAKEEYLAVVRSSIRNRPNATIAKEESLKTGKNFFISDKTCAVQIGRQLKKQFHGTLKISTTLFSQDRQTGKEVHRVTVLYRENEE